jgi:hypothetical protein
MRTRRPSARAVGVFALLLVALALSAGAGTASAATSASLRIYAGCESFDGNTTRHYDYTLVVQGTTSYQGDVREEFRLWGDDPYYDDLLAGPYVQHGSGGAIYFAFCVNTGTLNEDWGQDEIYVGVRVYNPVTGQQLDKAETNRIVNYF